MLTKPVLVLFVIVTFLTSCKQKEDAEANINSYANEVLIASQYVVEGNIRKTIKLMEERLNKPEARDTTLVYKQKADAVISAGNKLINYLDELLQRINRNEMWNANDSLFEKLKAYEVDVTKIDDRANQIFEKSILSIESTNDIQNMSKAQFRDYFFHGVNKDKIIRLLNSFKQKILIDEADRVHYFDMQCDISSCGYYKYVPIIMQNSTCFKPNDKLEITAGIGAFTSKAKPEFIINKKKLELEPDGAARYKMQVSNEKGKHIVPIRVSFIKPNGLHEVETKYVIYYVE